MYLFVTILILVVCVLLAIIVLVQNSKGGGLAANFTAQNQYMGVRKTADFLEKSTWWLAAILIVLSLVATMSIPRSVEEETVQSEVNINNITPVQSNQTAVPAAEVPVEAQTETAE